MCYDVYTDFQENSNWKIIVWKEFYRQNTRIHAPCAQEIVHNVVLKEEIYGGLKLQPK